MPDNTPNTVHRIAQRAYQIGGCYLFSGSRTKASTHFYGRVSMGGRRVRVHRAVYEAANGPIAPGLTVDHLCGNTLCVNPFHLEAVSSRENTMRGVGPSAINARKTHCKRGHELSGQNLLPPRNGWRECRKCDYARNRGLI